MSLVPASIKRIGSKTTEKRWRHRFPHYKSMGAFCCHGNQSFDPVCPKTLCSLFPHPSDATHKIWSRLADSPQRYSSLKVWTTTDGRRRRRTDDGPLVYYKLTLWAFGSGELKTCLEYESKPIIYFWFLRIVSLISKDQNKIYTALWLMYGAMFYGHHTAQHQLQWIQIKVSVLVWSNSICWFMR